MLQSLFEWLQAWPVSQGIRESSWMFPAFESVHVIAITLVVGSVVIVDLRVMGLTSRRVAVTNLSRYVLQWTWAMFVLASITGGFMFAAKASTYFDNAPFKVKILLMLAAGLNMLMFHFGPFRVVQTWNQDVASPMTARVVCGFSLVFWVLVVVMGRLIGFTVEG